MDKPLVFISHITEERELAELLKARMTRDFLNMIDVFVSSDHRSIAVGSRWLDEIDDALQRAHVELVLCTADSVRRPWVNFEAGAGWVKKIPVIPVCHTGMRPVSLPIPLNMLQGIEASDAAGLARMYSVLATKLGSNPPEVDFGEFISHVHSFEHRYGLVREVRGAVLALIELLPDLKQLFVPGSTTKEAAGDIPDYILNTMTPHLKLLQSKSMLEFGIAGNRVVFTVGGTGGNMVQVTIRVLPAYDPIAADIMKA